MLKRLVTRYLIVTGVVAHLALLALFIAVPDLAPKIRHIARLAVADRLAAQPPPGTPPAAALDAVRATLGRWRPRTGDGLGDYRVRVDGRPVADLAAAVKRLRDGSLLEIGAGIYTTGLPIWRDRVRVVGRGHVVFERAAHGGKATFVVRGNDTTIENLECRGVEVADGNGACVRLAGRNLTLDRVYFHSAQQGLLTGAEPGQVIIRDSYLEGLGHAGHAHAIYQGGGRLAIERSLVLATKGQGHAIKTRAHETRISHSVVASLESQDSRLIDAAAGGRLEVTDSVLQQGRYSANRDLIGFALEKDPHPRHDVVLLRNLILLERDGENRLLHSRADDLTTEIRDNLIVAAQDSGHIEANREFRSRAAAGLPPYPTIPAAPPAD